MTAALAPTREEAIVVADDDPAARALLAHSFARAGYAVVEASTGEEALEAVERDKPAAAIVEVALPGVCGYEVCRTLRERFGETVPVILVSATRTEPYDRVAGLLLGADDYLAKPVSPDEVLARVHRSHHGTRSRRRSELAAAMTGRERQVLHLLAEGLDQDEIAKRLFISTKTVATHIEHVLGKLGVRSRAQAVAMAYRDDLLDTA